MSTNKIDLVRAEIERLQDGLMDAQGRFRTNAAESAYHILCYLENFINSMQEEPTSVWHDANTLPSSPKAVIVEHNEHSTSICRAEQMSRVKGAKWAYIDDLIKL